jgi:pyruvate/2-oxoglutarate dehydrogenase complex dihydrolipoamide dehydrogenase (E3) component
VTTKECYDATVIGAGQAGGPLSRTLAQAGWKTTFIEREHVGGTCINEGCTPTKTMVASTRVVARPLPTFPTTTFAASAPICWKMETPPRPVACTLHGFH